MLPSEDVFAKFSMCMVGCLRIYVYRLMSGLLHVVPSTCEAGFEVQLQQTFLSHGFGQ